MARMFVVFYHTVTQINPFLCHICYTVNRELICYTSSLVMYRPMYEERDDPPLYVIVYRYYAV